MLTPVVFLTGGHCTGADAEGTLTTARVYFQQDAGANYDPKTEVDPVTGYPETCIPANEPLCVTSDQLFNYGFNDFEGFPDNRDLGLVILDDPVELPEYGALAETGTLDVLVTRRGQQDPTFTVSGYGVTDAREHPASRALSFRKRLMATAKLINLRNALTDGFNLQTSANAGWGCGGSCYGNSGGPVLYPANSNVIVSVTSFGKSPWCTGVDFSYRVDTKAALAWIQTTVERAVSAAEAKKIEIVKPSTQPLATGSAADTGKAKHQKHGKAKGEKGMSGQDHGRR